MISSEFTVLSGKTNSELSNLICNRLGIKLGNCNVVQMSNKETVVDIGDSVRGRDVFIIQTISKNVNDSLMELLILTYACKTSSARQIVGVIPYLPYCKQSKMRKRGCIVSKLLAQMLCKAGMTHAITIDLHQKEIQGFFDIPIDNLRASPFLIHYIQTSIPDYRNAVIVAKNPASAKRAQSYAERLRLGLAVIHGEQKEAEEDEIDGRQSPPAIPRASESAAAAATSRTNSRSQVTSADGTAVGGDVRKVAVGTENVSTTSGSVDAQTLASRLSNLQNGPDHKDHIGHNDGKDWIKCETQSGSSHSIKNNAKVVAPVPKTESAVDVVKPDHDISNPGETSLIDRMEISKSDLFGSFHYLPILTQKEKPPLNVVGDVGGRIAIMVDDIIDEPDVFISAAELLKERGAYKIYLMATHGIFSGDSPTLLQESPIDLIVVTNTVPHEIQKMQCTKIETIDISMLLSEAIRRIHYQESMSHLFRNISTTD